MNIDIIGNVTGNELSVIKDPFNKDCVGDIAIHYTSTFGKPYWWARVEFKNDNTKGEQRTPNCGTFEEIVAQVKIILDSVRDK